MNGGHDINFTEKIVTMGEYRVKEVLFLTIDIKMGKVVCKHLIESTRSITRSEFILLQGRKFFLRFPCILFSVTSHFRDLHL